MNDIEAFFKAIEQGNADEVRSFIASTPEAVLAKHDGATALHVAAMGNHREIVDLLLGHGADLNAVDDKFGATPAGWANERGLTGIVEYLCGRGTVVDLNRAAAFGLIGRVRELLAEEGTVVNSLDGYGRPIHEASLWGHPGIVELLLERGADPNLENCDGQTALAVALRQVESGCKDTPIVVESRRQEIEAGCKKVVDLLRKHGART
jgi:ankyrin repeat protein